MAIIKREMCIQNAFMIMQERNPNVEKANWTPILNHVLNVRGEEKLYEYAKNIKF